MSNAKLDAYCVGEAGKKIVELIEQRDALRAQIEALKVELRERAAALDVAAVFWRISQERDQWDEQGLMPEMDP